MYPTPINACKAANMDYNGAVNPIVASTDTVYDADYPELTEW